MRYCVDSTLWISIDIIEYDPTYAETCSDNIEHITDPKGFLQTNKIDKIKTKKTDWNISQHCHSIKPVNLVNFL